MQYNQVMRTGIFNSFADLPREFKEDFEGLWSLPEKQRSALVPYVSQLAKAETTGDTKRIIDAAISQIGGDAPTVLRSLKVLNFISKQWDPINDTPEDFLRDLNELSLIPSEQVDEAKRFLLDLLAELQKDNTRRLQKSYANSLLPSFIGIEALIDFRAIIERPFGVGIDDTIETYEPRCVGFVPVILLALQCDSGDPSTLRFQCEPEDLHVLIENLQAALKELESAKASIPGGSR